MARTSHSEGSPARPQAQHLRHVIRRLITCPRGSTHDELFANRSSFIHSLLGNPRRGQFLMTPRGSFPWRATAGIERPWSAVGP